RTLGLGPIADREWASLPPDIQNLLRAYTAGINALIDDAGTCLPIEFDLLDYRPEPWIPTDCLAIMGEFRWYLTGRFPVIVIPELAKRALGEGALYEAVLLAEADLEAILPPGAYPTSSIGVSPLPLGEGQGEGGTTARSASAAVSDAESNPNPESQIQNLKSPSPPHFDGKTGSNNWVVSGQKSASGKPLLASDPHIAFAAVSCWHEVHLSGGSFNVAG